MKDKIRTAEEILKQNYFGLENADEQDWKEGSADEMHKCILESMEEYAKEYHSQFENNKNIEDLIKKYEAYKMQAFDFSPKVGMQISESEQEAIRKAIKHIIPQIILDLNLLKNS